MLMVVVAAIAEVMIVAIVEVVVAHQTAGTAGQSTKELATPGLAAPPALPLSAEHAQG